MRRDQFIKSVLALAAGSSFALPSLAAANIKMMIPANPGGGWDTTGRALGKALQDAGVASSVTYENKGGAAGIIGLAQYANATKGDGNSLMVMGAVMLGGIITGKPPVSLDKVTPIARLTSEYNVFVVPANSPLKTMKDVVEQMKKDPGSVKWGGGSRGSTEHIAAAMLAREVGVDAAKINYVPFRGGGGLNSSQLPDAQSAYETMMTMMPTFLAGTNFVMHTAGWLEGGLVSSIEKYVIDVQILESLIHEFTPIHFDDEALAFGAHEEVGHAGHFLGAMHTMERFRDCFYRPFLSSSDNFERWTRNGSKDTATRAGEIAEKTLEDYEKPPIDESIEAALLDYVNRRRTELGD